MKEMFMFLLLNFLIWSTGQWRPNCVHQFPKLWWLWTTELKVRQSVAHHSKTTVRLFTEHLDKTIHSYTKILPLFTPDSNKYFKSLSFWSFLTFGFHKKDPWTYKLVSSKLHFHLGHWQYSKNYRWICPSPAGETTHCDGLVTIS